MANQRWMWRNLEGAAVVVMLALTGCGVADLSSLSAQDETVFVPDVSGPDRVFAALAATEFDVDGTGIEPNGPAVDVMTQKLNDAIGTLDDPNAPEETHLRAVDQVMEALFVSNLVPLPTAGVPEADPGFNDHLLRMQEAINALNRHVDPPGPGTGNSKDAAWEARNFLQLFQEAVEVIAQETAQCDPNNLRDAFCENLLADDETGVDVDAVFPGFSRQVRGPFLVSGTAGGGTIQEQVIVPGPIGLDECAIVLKEIQGVKAIVRPVLIPIWVEPWNARAAIVGFKTVWVWEFVPAEFLKTITFCNNGGTVVQDVDIIVVIERELLHFWTYPAKEITLTP